MAEDQASLNRSNSLEHSGGFSEAMLHFKRAAVFKRKLEPSYSFCLHKHYCKAANRSNKIHCDCGETEDDPLAWHWDRGRSTRSATFRPTHVACHETLSTGTALLVGDTPLEAGGHHYFEVKLLTDLYGTDTVRVKLLTDLHGTDTMVGVCTDQLDPAAGEQRFVSLLGADNHSWGLSYHGKAQHGGTGWSYGPEFGKGSIVGVYANLRSGRLEFFLNRRSLGVAFTNLPCGPGSGVRLYPAFCTTAANTCVRLVSASSVPDSLQFQATAVVTRSLPRWSLALPAALCRLVRRFAWLEYRQPAQASPGDDAVQLLDDSPAHQPVRPPPTLALTAARSGGAGDRLGGDGPDLGWSPLEPDRDTDSPPVAVVNRASLPAAAVVPSRRLRLYVSPEEEPRAAAAPPDADASPPLRERPRARVTLVAERRGRARRRSGAAPPPAVVALGPPGGLSPRVESPIPAEELLDVAMVDVAKRRSWSGGAAASRDSDGGSKDRQRQRRRRSMGPEELAAGLAQRGPAARRRVHRPPPLLPSVPEESFSEWSSPPRGSGV
ncbi:SPRY domain-containing SOCS box protein 3 [Amphibalanus amphitrite]|uniref:SPRY domain-containing SOCS box protein 3 n=1 Tax=Amphibalanus amphitrite TaxID=1232801 RepID=A0A6A4VK84_AMPAM|nr:SPRY domain-containing SOCS box protein 3 [Amphibalanus amphitrite]